MPQIARVWFGQLRASQIEEYREYVKKTGAQALRGTPGNQGVWLLTRTDGDLAEIGVISFWDSKTSIQQFAGNDIDRAVYYPEDEKYLLKLEPKLLHYEVESQK